MDPKVFADKIVGIINDVLVDSDVVKKASDADKKLLTMELGAALQAEIPRVNVLETEGDRDLRELEMKNMKSAEADPMGMYMITTGKKRSRVTNVRKDVQSMIMDIREGRRDWANGFNLT